MRASIRRFVAPALIMSLAVLPAACGMITGLDRCGEERRELLAFGREGPLGAPETIIAQVNLLQIQGGPVQGSWQVDGPVLKAHVTEVELRDGPNGPLIASLPLSSLPERIISQGSDGEFRRALSVPEGEAWARLSAGRVVLELRTDLPERPLVRLAVPVGHQTGFGRAKCNY